MNLMNFFTAMDEEFKVVAEPFVIFNKFKKKKKLLSYYSVIIQLLFL